MHKTLRLSVLLAVAAGLAIPARAAEEKKYRFEFFGGVNYPLQKNFQISYPQTSQTLKGTQHFSAGGRGGVRFGIDGARHWGQDYAYSYAANTSRIVTGNGTFSFTNHFHEASTNVLFYPLNLEKTRVHFFVTGGVGALWVVINKGALQEALNPGQAGLGTLKNEVKFSFNAGAGVRFRINDRFGLRVDMRDYMSSALRYGLPASSDDPNAIVFPVEHAFHQILASVSLVVHF
jgi:hypothetical protein